jgi:hypothetical protein
MIRFTAWRSTWPDRPNIAYWELVAEGDEHSALMEDEDAVAVLSFRCAERDEEGICELVLNALTLQDWKLARRITRRPRIGEHQC